MPIKWPTNLQQSPLRDGFRAQGQDNLIRSPTETGPGQTRPRQTTAPVDGSAAIICTAAQYDDLWYFYRTVTAYGALRFYWDGLSEGIGGGSYTYTFAKGGQPTKTPFKQSMEFQASMQLVAWPAVPYLQALLFAAGEVGGMFLPSGPRWENAGMTLPADTAGDTIAVWEPYAGPSNATAPSAGAQPTLVD